jgi:hypothetical protein
MWRLGEHQLDPAESLMERGAPKDAPDSQLGALPVTWAVNACAYVCLSVWMCT